MRNSARAHHRERSDRNQTTVAKQIFQRSFRVRIPMIHCYSSEYLRTVGIPTTGDREWDRELMNETEEKYLRTAEMVKIHGEGGDITFVKPEQAKEVYQMLTQHLENWQQVIENDLHNRQPPMEDLELMDSFREALWPIAQRYMQKDVPTTGVMERIQTKMGGAALSKAQAISVDGPVRNPMFADRRPYYHRSSNDPHPEQQGEEKRAQEDGGMDIEKDMHKPIADSISRLQFRRRK